LPENPSAGQDGFDITPTGTGGINRYNGTNDNQNTSDYLIHGDKYK